MLNNVRILNGLLRSVNVLNIILLLGALLLADYVVLPLLNVKVKYIPAVPKKISTEKEEKSVQSQIPNAVDYTIIADQNLFHPERKIPPEKKEEAALPKPEFVLYGTMITDNMSFAYIEDRKSPRSTPGRGKRQTALKKGDTMSGYILKEIEHDKVVMVKGEDILTVKVIDSSVKKDREAASPSTASSTPSVGTQVRPAPAAQPQRPATQPPAPDQAVKPRRTPYRPPQ
jgi:type II secretory pathway component PulC